MPLALKILMMSAKARHEQKDPRLLREVGDLSLSLFAKYGFQSTLVDFSY
ncbi:hypothetical protein IQ243_03960 [Nostocales cyanobacterium LEGE 11386]|nr:hypothetical protein [Nostocales cyanobacterium LEGE 11386]